MSPQRYRFFLVMLGLSVFSKGYSDFTNTEQLLAEMSVIKNDPILLEQALVSGKERALLCGNCHGKNGNSVRDYIPNLASQNAAYLFNQFELFATGERKDYVMGRLAKGFSREDKINIALYFSVMPVEPRELSVTVTAQGEKIYQSYCFTCHQKDGHGLSLIHISEPTRLLSSEMCIRDRLSSHRWAALSISYKNIKRLFWWR